jgi:pimeloyl-ACP methyl ester carboxylesterase
VKSDDCPLGDDADEGVQRVVDLMDELDAKPLPGSGDRKLTEGRAFYGIAVALYGEETWSFLTDGLEQAIDDGDGAALVAMSDEYFGRQDDGSYDSNLGQVISAVTCLDSPDRLTEADVRAQIPRFVEASPVFGRALAWGALGCADWPIEATNPRPVIDGKGAPPILVLGTTRDPATPYESAQALASQLESAVLLTRDGDGHTAYLSGNKCIEKAVESYLVDGTMPADDTIC